jgi:hypothetical protein
MDENQVASATVKMEKASVIDEPETAAHTDESAEESALQHDIRTKGQNSYYYAHKKHDEWDDSMAWDGNEAPRLLSKGSNNTTKGPLALPDDVSPTAVIPKAKANAKEVIKTFDKYLFEDAGTKVKVYILLEGIGEISDESISLVGICIAFPFRHVHDFHIIHVVVHICYHMFHKYHCCCCYGHTLPGIRKTVLFSAGGRLPGCKLGHGH